MLPIDELIDGIRLVANESLCAFVGLGKPEEERYTGAVFVGCKTSAVPKRPDKEMQHRSEMTKS